MSGCKGDLTMMTISLRGASMSDSRFSLRLDLEKTAYMAKFL